MSKLRTAFGKCPTQVPNAPLICGFRPLVGEYGDVSTPANFGVLLSFHADTDVQAMFDRTSVSHDDSKASFAVARAKPHNLICEGS